MRKGSYHGLRAIGRRACAECLLNINDASHLGRTQYSQGAHNLSAASIPFSQLFQPGEDRRVHIGHQNVVGVSL